MASNPGVGATSFFDLPRELRDEVYGYIISDPKDSTPAKMPGYWENSTHLPRLQNTYPLNGLWHDTNHGAWLANKQMARELQEYERAGHHYVAHPASVFSSLRQKILPVQQQNSLRSLELQFNTEDSEPDDGTTLMRRSRKYSKMYMVAGTAVHMMGTVLSGPFNTQFNNLKHLTLRIYMDVPKAYTQKICTTLYHQLCASHASVLTFCNNPRPALESVTLTFSMHDKEKAVTFEVGGLVAKYDDTSDRPGTIQKQWYRGADFWTVYSDPDVHAHNLLQELDDRLWVRVVKAPTKDAVEFGRAEEMIADAFYQVWLEKGKPDVAALMDLKKKREAGDLAGL
ncbi:uncharacterized protein K452DRAFT_317894 [Aplosporella prunicola CBS 121167]|uniref:Uncharacterized protein n=1 Tax=Aplosporella prunicola CBS 121167 TaxID=1176127 RepID=A0A6A6BFU0_9PEZI|nr:uncharacterized protein K452DRAFT_317894 [Aplosporella prunicola CBS 121167]KAF2143012.1 hypothetical protein K452DRAFT_317894 [Aplosporella prunicola CBS 121167]